MESFRSFVSLEESSESDLRNLWKKFISDTESLGYQPKPNVVVSFHRKDLSPNDVSGFVDLETPNRKELGLKNKAFSKPRKMERDPYYNTLRAKLKEELDKLTTK